MPKALQRVAVIGASLSDGFGATPLSRLLNKAIAGKAGRQPVARLASSMFFARPLVGGRQQIDRAIKREATLVVGADYLFWYAYGFPGGIRQRAGKAVELRTTDRAGRDLAIRGWQLAQGLAELERLDVRVVIGDLPDMTGAHPMMLKPAQIPSRATLDKLNERIRAWAAPRKNVLLLPMAEWMTQLRAGKLSLPNRKGGGEPIRLSAEKMMSWDRLHPTKLGTVVFCSLLVDKLRSWVGQPIADSLHFDTWRILDDSALATELEEPSKRLSTRPARKSRK
ncbi:MAG: hypothetical protein CMJ85_04455 [Planctomycetes bacterium]|nr:hypothetical protein [Planctomycetota bacterium]